jgi:hypothetical protein
MQICYQIHRTSSSLRYVNCGPGNIQFIHNSSYSGNNIQLNVSALQLEIFRHFDARCTANLVSNTAHIVRFTLCELWSRTYTKHLWLRLFGLQYSAVAICAVMVDITSIQCALYCTLGAKYRAHPPVYAMRSVVPDIYNAIAAPHIQVSIINWEHLLYCRRYLHNAMHVVPQPWCQLRRTSSDLCYVNGGPGHIQYNYSRGIQASIFSWSYLRCYWRYLENSMRVILQTWCLILRTSSGLPYVDCGPGHMQCNYSSGIQASIFKWTYLSCYSIYVDNSMSVILQIWCQI